MNIPVLTFFNNKGGVGKTSLVYHIAHMMAALGYRPLAVDLDPQCNLTASFLDEEKVETLWSVKGKDEVRTIYEAMEPLLEGTGDVTTPDLHAITTLAPSADVRVTAETMIQVEDGIRLIAGDMRMSSFEDELSRSWNDCLGKNPRAFRVQSAFWRVMQMGAQNCGADLILADIGPNLGSINRATLVASDYLVTPLAPDLYSLQGLRNLGPTLRRWRVEWEQRRGMNPTNALDLPQGAMHPLGYVVMQHSVANKSRPAKHYEKWIHRIPADYCHFVLNQPNGLLDPASDDHCLAMLKHYRSLMPMAQEAGKPVFRLKPADGAIGTHMQGVQSAYLDFKSLAEKICAGMRLPHE